MKTSILAVGAVAMIAPATPALRAQQPVAAPFMVDVISSRAPELLGRPRCDVYVAVPFSLLKFVELDTGNVAEYTLETIIRDSTGRKVVDSTYRRTIVEDEVAVTRGSTGAADNSVRRYRLTPGSYRCEFVLRDVFGKRDFSLSQKIVVPAFPDGEASMSSVMLVREIEQRGDRYAITPFIGDILWSKDIQLFAFVDCYVPRGVPQVGLHWAVTATDGRILASGTGEPVDVSSGAAQAFIPLVLPQRMMPGTYQLRLRLHPWEQRGSIDTTQTLTERSRQLIIPRSSSGAVLSDLSKAIRQLIYVADQADIDMINSGTTEADKLAQFDEYWKRLDPTPATVRNEAFEEFYDRVEQANRRFKSYSEGWLTDMGRVFIIYGEPLQVDRFSTQSGMSVAVRWMYPNNLMFTFEDASGFGDFRLRTPMPAGAKYRYRR